MTWSTTDELAFIEGLGLHRDRSLTPQITHNEERLRLLRGYLAGLKLRTNMTGLDRAALEARATALIEQLTKNKENK